MPEASGLAAHPGTHRRSQAPACGSGCGSCSHSPVNSGGRGGRGPRGTGKGTVPTELGARVTGSEFPAEGWLWLQSRL